MKQNIFLKKYLKKLIYLHLNEIKQLALEAIILSAAYLFFSLRNVGCPFGKSDSNRNS